MKVICESDIFNRIKEITTTTTRKIVRVEMSNDEFAELLDDIYVTHAVSPLAFEMIRTIPCVNRNGHSGYDWSGSYVVYKGVCFQTHSSYTD